MKITRRALFGGIRSALLGGMATVVGVKALSSQRAAPVGLNHLEGETVVLMHPPPGGYMTATEIVTLQEEMKKRIGTAFSVPGYMI